jgi:hypothetical protein
MPENTPIDNEQEEKAFRALFVAAFHQDGCDDTAHSDINTDAGVRLTEDDLSALERLGNDLVDRIISGNAPCDPNTHDRSPRSGHLVAMHRCDELKEVSQSARAEMDKKIAEADQQRSKGAGT